MTTAFSGLRAAAVLCLLVFTTNMLPAQSKRERIPEPDAKATGEQYNIDQRREWFIQSRGLDRVERPDKLRSQAVEGTKRAKQRMGKAADHNWVEVGPSPMTMLSWSMGNVAGRVSAIAYDPSNTDTIYLGAAAGGVWKTIDGGSNWTSLFDDVGTTTIGAIYLNPADPNDVWVGTGDHWTSCYSYQGQGLFHSIDGGSSWTAVNGSGANTLDLTFIAAIAVHPTNPQIMMVGGLGYCAPGSSTYGSGGLYRTTDGGANWTRIITGSVYDIVWDDTDPNTFYASVGDAADAVNGVYKSTDSGANWTRQQSGILYGTDIGRIRIAMAPSDNQTLYALLNRSAGGTYLYQSTNGGNSWTLKNTGACEGQCAYNLCLDVHPTNPNTLLVGSIRFALSTNGGSSLSYQTSGWGSGQAVHQDTHVLKFHPGNGNTYWVGSDGGIWKTTNNGSSFSNLNGNLNITQFYDVAVNPNDPATIFGGSQDNSSERTTGNVEWNVTVVSGDGFMNLVDPRNTNTVYQTSYAYSSGGGELPRIYRSTSGGSPNSFGSLSNSGISAGPFAWVVPLAVAANQAGTRTYIFCGSNRPYRRADNASSWTSMASSGVTGNVELSVIAPVAYNNDMTVYVGNYDGQIFRTDNGLASSPGWTNVTGNYPDDIKVSDIAPDPNNPLRVFITRGGFALGQLFRSTTGGTTWTQVGAGLPDVPANSVAIDPFDTNRIYVGTDVGVYQSYDNGDNFTVMMDGMPLGVPVTDLEVTDNPHVLTAGTYGRGAWQTALTSSGNTAPSVSITAPANGTTITVGAGLNFTGTATDAEDGTLTGSLSWSSNIDGSLGSGGSVSATLSVGTHTITASVTDSGGLAGSDSITVTVNPVGGSWTTILDTDFESGWGPFSDGGSDCRRSSRDSAYAYQGTYCVRIRDNTGSASAFQSTNSFDLSGKTQLRVSFAYRPVGMETGEDFMVELWDGSAWQIIGQWVSGSDFSNNNFYTPQFTITNSSVNFSSSAYLRFRCDASANNDRIYVDTVLVEAQ
ncbi:MAG: hypothetical protein QNK37_36585 [Acidobacteriota bacterium]|nr:hypothetical protein [Acidobacteriota bacterium]